VRKKSPLVRPRVLSQGPPSSRFFDHPPLQRRPHTMWGSATAGNDDALLYGVLSNRSALNRVFPPSGLAANQSYQRHNRSKSVCRGAFGKSHHKPTFLIPPCRCGFQISARKRFFGRILGCFPGRRKRRALRVRWPLLNNIPNSALRHRHFSAQIVRTDRGIHCQEHNLLRRASSM